MAIAREGYRFCMLTDFSLGFFNSWREYTGLLVSVIGELAKQHAVCILRTLFHLESQVIVFFALNACYWISRLAKSCPIEHEYNNE